MLAAIASAALIVGGSVILGQAILAACGQREWTGLGGPVGFAALLAIAAIVAGLDGKGIAIGVVLGVPVVVAAVALARLPSRPRLDFHAIAAAALAALFAAVPFIAAADVGILGVGLVNDDMASHLLLADWIDERFRPEPVLIDQGYPLGPHALVAGLSSLLGASSIDVFAGLTLAIPALTALLAFGALDGLRPVARTLASALVALPYLGAAYLAQEAFKEPTMALFVLAFALLLFRARSWRDGVPLGVLAAGVMYVYSFPGLAWLGGVAGLWAVLVLWRRRTGEDRDPGPGLGPIVGGAAACVAVLVVLALPSFDSFRDFADFRALHPDRANEGGLGNLPGQLSPLEALGIWPTSEFRLSASASSLPAAVFYLGGAFALVALALALPRWARRHGPALVTALVAAAVLYLLARALGTVYTSAKALAIAAPLVALITLGGLLASERRGMRLIGVGFGVLAALCSFLILRQAPVAPTAHADELARIRPLVQGEKVLFLGRDNFVLYELRGSKPYTHVRNFYDPYFVEPNFELANVGAKFDFDSVTAKTLAGFPFVLTTRAAYASGPPPGYELAERTASYELWRNGASPLGREPGEVDAAPGREGGCGPARTRDAVAFARAPVVADEAAWSRATIESGESAEVELELGAGTWDLSLRYDSTRPVELTATGLDATLPGNLDYRGVAPFWPAGSIEVAERGPVTITARVQDPPLAGRIMGARSVAHLGPIAATAAQAARSGCDGYVDWYLERNGG